MTELISLAAEINKEHNLAEQMAKTAIEHALKAGELLIQAKGQCGHGEWLPWLDGNLDIGARQAQRYMRLAIHREALVNTTSPTHLTIDTALAAIASPSEPEQADKQPHEMGWGAVCVIYDLDALNYVIWIEWLRSLTTTSDRFLLSYKQRLNITKRFVNNRSGPLGDYSMRYSSLRQQASDFGWYCAGRHIAADMESLGKTADEIIDSYVEQKPELDSEWLKFKYRLSLTLAQPPELPKSSDLSDYIDSQLLASAA